MESLVNIARKFNMRYKQLKERMIDLYILEKDGKHFKPTETAIEKGIAIRLSFDNGMITRYYYKWNKELLQHHIINGIKLEEPKTELPF